MNLFVQYLHLALPPAEMYDIHILTRGLGPPILKPLVLCQVVHNQMMKIHDENLLFSSESSRAEFLSLIGLAFERFLIWDIFEKSRGNVNAIMRERGGILQPTKHTCGTSWSGDILQCRYHQGPTRGS